MQLRSFLSRPSHLSALALLLWVLLVGCVGTGPTGGSSPGNVASSVPPAAGPTARPGEERTFRIIPQQSTASYQAQEKWLRWPLPTKAGARTDDVEGELVLVMGDQPKLASSHFRVDMRTLVSQAEETPLFERPAGLFLSQRDYSVRKLLEADTYQYAEFTATSIEGLPTQYAPPGQPVKVRVPGDLTIHGVTRPTILDTEATLRGDALSGTVSAQISMTDFGVQPPRAAGGNAMDVEDQVTINVKFTATAAPAQNLPTTSTDRHPKFDATLAAVAQVMRERGVTESLREAQGRSLDVVGDRIRVILRHPIPPGPDTGPAALRAVVENAGARSRALLEAPSWSWCPFRRSCSSRTARLWNSCARRSERMQTRTSCSPSRLRRRTTSPAGGRKCRFRGGAGAPH